MTIERRAPTSRARAEELWAQGRANVLEAARANGCAHCGKAIDEATALVTGEGAFCSHTCSEDARQARRERKRKYCVVCGASIDLERSRLRPKVKTCDRESCKRTRQRETNKEWMRRSRNAVPRQARTHCIVCEHEIKEERRERNPKTMTCSDECRRERGLQQNREKVRRHRKRHSQPP